MSAEKLLTPKELATEINAQHGIVVSARFIRSMMRAGVKRVGYYATTSDVMAWWYENPDFSPRSLASQDGRDGSIAA